MGKYASGKFALRLSDRSGQSFPYNEMVQEWNGSWVHVSEFEPKQPQLDPKNHPTDFQALQHARPQVVNNIVYVGSGIVNSNVGSPQKGTYSGFGNGLATNSYETLIQEVTLSNGTVIKQRSMMPLSVEQPNKEILLSSRSGTVTVVIS